MPPVVLPPYWLESSRRRLACSANASYRTWYTPVAEFVLRWVTANSLSVATCSSRRSSATDSTPSGSVQSFCHEYWRCVVANGDCPNAVSDTESSLPEPTVSSEIHLSPTRLRLTTDHASSVVAVRSSKYGAPASKALLRRLR